MLFPGPPIFKYLFISLFVDHSISFLHKGYPKEWDLLSHSLVSKIKSMADKIRQGEYQFFVISFKTIQFDDNIDELLKLPKNAYKFE